MKVRFQGIVNGKVRSTWVDVPAEYANDVDEVEKYVMNIESAYDEFYKGASDDEVDLNVLQPRVYKKGKGWLTSEGES